MSPSPALSDSSGQSCYFDAPVMHFNTHRHETSEERQGMNGFSQDNNPGGSTRRNHQNNAPQPEGTSSTSKQQNGKAPAEPKSPSLRSLPTEPADQEKPPAGGDAATRGSGTALGRNGSVRTTRSTRTSRAISAFANGAPLTGPDAEPDVDQSLFIRGANAERSLSQKQKDKISKEEKKDSKKYMKMLKTESSTEKAALDSALKTLSAFQELHKTAIKREAKAEAAHAKALAAAQKAASRFHEEKARAAELRARAEARCTEERARWEGKEEEVRAQQERLESERATVKETEARVTECAREVERLRIVKGTDEREREVKYTKLTGQE